jgi:pilus assembly protein CpaF
VKLSDKLAERDSQAETADAGTANGKRRAGASHAAARKTPAKTKAEPAATGGASAKGSTAKGRAGGDPAPTSPVKKASTKRAPASRPAAKRSGSSSPANENKGRRKEDETARWVAAKREVRDAVVKDLVSRVTGPDKLEGEALEAEVTAHVDRQLSKEELRISVAERRAFVSEVISDILGYGPLDLLFADDSITEVMCNDFDDVWIERAGVIERSRVVFADREQYRRVIDKIVSAVGRRVDESSPMVDARLPDGSRVNVIVPPIAVHGPCMTIRRFSEDPFTISDLISFGSVSDDLAVVLEACVRGELNVLVSGGTATGKTTFLNVLSQFIPEHERIITIEDAAELQLQQPHVVTLEARPANAEGQGAVAIRDLVRNALRMRPDRIVVGECRGAEALDMLQAMNTGHDGSLTTLHANSARDALSRLEMLVMMAGIELPDRAVREMIAAAIDLIVQIERLPDGSRKVTSVQEIQGMEDRTIILQELFRYEPKMDSKGRYVGVGEPTGLRPRFVDKLKPRGIDIPAAVLTARAPTPRRSAAATSRKRR